MSYASLLFAVATVCVPVLVFAQQPWEETWNLAIEAAESHEFRVAIRHAEAAREMGLAHPQLDYYLGRWNFQAGRAQQSVERFDAYLKKSPARANSLWERGISCYYAGDYRAGAKQFEDYQTFHNNDVENAVWRYLCQARIDGKAKARQAMLPISNDRRIPMMEVYRLFKGQGKPADVLQNLKSSRSTGKLKKTETMHAHLYLGLYYDSEGNADRALKHLRQSVEQFENGSYMWSVAVVHEQHLKEKTKLAKDEEQ